MSVCAKQFKKGQLIVFDPFVKDLEGFPYATCGYSSEGCFELYEKINLETYPSWNDFKGSKISVERGVTGIVLASAGVPFNILVNREKFDINVYNVLIRGHKVQVFGMDIQKVKKKLK